MGEGKCWGGCGGREKGGKKTHKSLDIKNATKEKTEEEEKKKEEEEEGEEEEKNKVVK